MIKPKDALKIAAWMAVFGGLIGYATMAIPNAMLIVGAVFVGGLLALIDVTFDLMNIRGE